MRWTAYILILGCCCLGLMYSAALPQEPVPLPQQLLTPGDIILLASADAASLHPSEAAHTRFLWIPNQPTAERIKWYRRLCLQGNLLHPRSLMLTLRPVKGTDGHLLALDLREYRFSPDVWEQFLESDHTFGDTVGGRVEEYEVEEEKVWPGGKDMEGKEWPKGYKYMGKVKKTRVVDGGKQRVVNREILRLPLTRIAYHKLSELTHSKIPVVNAFIFFQSTASCGISKPDYYDIQGIKDEKTFLELVGAEIAKDVAFSRDKLGHTSISGVTQEPRMIQAVRTRGGIGWSSFDQELGKSQEQANALRNIGSDAQGKVFFGFTATEKIYPDAKGAPKFFLGNRAGVKQDRAPDKVASSDKPVLRNNHSVINCISCIDCHTENMYKPIDEWVRNFRDAKLDAFNLNQKGKPEEDFEENFRRREQYAGSLDSLLKSSREQYAAFLQAFNQEVASHHAALLGLKEEAYLKQYPVSGPSVALDYRAGWEQAANVLVDLDYASRELGVKPERIVAAQVHQVRLGKADPVAAQFALPAEKRKPLSLSAYREVFGRMQADNAECP